MPSVSHEDFHRSTASGELEIIRLDLAQQMEKLANTHTRLLRLHEEVCRNLSLTDNDRITSRNKSSRVANPAPVAQPSHKSSMDAGPRLIGTYDLLEMILEEVPNDTILSAQRVTQQFRYVITTSARLQSKLFFHQGSSDPDPSVTTLNPLVSQANILASLPIWFDPEIPRLAYCSRPGRKRLYCRKLSVRVDEDGGAPFIRLELTYDRPNDPEPEYSLAQNDNQKLRLLEKGTWKEMYLSQPCREIRWYARVPSNDNASAIARRTRVQSQGITWSFYGRVEGKGNLDGLLEELADSAAIAVDA